MFVLQSECAIINGYLIIFRYRHEMVSDGFKLYVFGGGTAHAAFPLDKVSKYCKN